MGKTALWRFIKGLISLRANISKYGPIDADAALENLKPLANFENSLCAEIPYGEHSFDLYIHHDELPVEECLQIARRLLVSFEVMNKKALMAASGDLLEIYNDSWRGSSDRWSEGQSDYLPDRKITRSEFEAIIAITSVSVSGPFLEFCYCSKGLFGSHSIMVTSFDGLDFSDIGTNLLG